MTKYWHKCHSKTNSNREYWILVFRNCIEMLRKSGGGENNNEYEC